LHGDQDLAGVETETKQSPLGGVKTRRPRAVSPLVVVATCASAAVDAQSRDISVEVRAPKAVDAPVLETVRLYSNSYALAVGIDNYDSWTNLSNASRGADKTLAAHIRKGFPFSPEEPKQVCSA
jgi:hypothetical protein